VLSSVELVNPNIHWNVCFPLYKEVVELIMLFVWWCAIFCRFCILQKYELQFACMQSAETRILLYTSAYFIPHIAYVINPVPALSWLHFSMNSSRTDVSGLVFRVICLLSYVTSKRILTRYKLLEVAEVYLVGCRRVYHDMKWERV
jgi:hypothetical protein